MWKVHSCWYQFWKNISFQVSFVIFFYFALQSNIVMAKVLSFMSDERFLLCVAYGVHHLVYMTSD